MLTSLSGGSRLPAVPPTPAPSVATEKLRAALAASERADRLDAQGGPIRARRAAENREHARLWALGAASDLQAES